MNTRVYGPDVPDKEIEDQLQIKYKHPELAASQDALTRHIRFEIAEANAMSAVGAFGKMVHYVGLPFFPIMTVYDFFIKRALDQPLLQPLLALRVRHHGYALGGNFCPPRARSTPWKSDIQIPNLITWEPSFAPEVDWILSDAIRRHMMDENDGRRGVLIRCVTRGLKQSLLLENLRKHARSKVRLKGPLKPRYAGNEWGEAYDESTVAAKSDSELLKAPARGRLGGRLLSPWTGGATPATSRETTSSTSS